MIAKILMKNPVLIIGIILMGLFLNDIRKKGYFDRNQLKPTSCKASLIMLDKRIPSTWSTKCNANEMVIEIQLDTQKIKKENKSSFIYRELANHLIFISKNVHDDSLSRVEKIYIYEKTQDLTVLAMTKGQYLIKFKTLKSSSHIMKHLQNTVTVKEIRK